MGMKLLRLRRWAPTFALAEGGHSNWRQFSSAAMRYGRPLGAVLLLGATGVAAASALKNILIYHGCSSKAMERAAKDPRMKKLLGESIEKGFWYEASLGLSHEGRSASCSFPIYGNQGHANLHLRAVKYEETGNKLANLNIFSQGNWEVLVLEALVPSSSSESANKLDRINLMEENNAPKSGDWVRGSPGPCRSAAIREV
ncbi:hypothetical protein O6H91_04G035900 [Diphasiastrum complanatum]|uniref:Uncharacterized protein n=1 Tax=Diphasiastrum complanatum TaxID=34168 RepID=A0ACC2DWI6_DIPCM|nr:hypothetical protein O6H91_04G035900 [Diphasiastrum complanatum]